MIDESSPYAPWIDGLVKTVQDAGTAIMNVYFSDFSVARKSDGSPVTEADQRAEAVILAHLRELTPDLAVVAEEEAEKGVMQDVGNRFWLVDPLDGTKEFIERSGEFTVNVALVDNGRPVLGMVLAPALGKLYVGAVGGGAFLEDQNGRRRISCRPPPAEGLTVVASRTHGDVEKLKSFLDGHLVARFKSAGSSLKFCLLASGEADLYPRFGRTMKWDTAAGHAVLVAAGGRVTTESGEPLIYRKPGFNNPSFVAWGLTE